MSHTRLHVSWYQLLYLVCMFCVVVACQSQKDSTTTDIYSIKHAKKLLRTAIELCIEDPVKGREALKQFLLTEEQIKQLFRADVAPALALYYREEIVPQFLEEAPTELAALYSQGHTYLKYLAVATNNRIGNFPGDLKLLTAFKEKPAIYGLRLMVPEIWLLHHKVLL